MGNYTSSCFLLKYPNPRTAKLMDSQGILRHVKLPVRAAELMLEEPSHVVAPVHELRRTSRVIGLRADDELLAGMMYLLVPLSRVHRKISESEMAMIESAANREKMSRKKRRGGKVLPAVDVESEEEADQVEVQVQVLSGEDGNPADHRTGNFRQWTPVLEPISEEF